MQTGIGVWQVLRELERPLPTSWEEQRDLILEQ
jgi:hypothetical protein